jgi:CRP/FNR family transcriptional regulator/CRP/FNR family cyclic AMP-dependent transcriptional regulator
MDAAVSSDQLADFALFAGLKPDQLAAVIRVMRTRNFANGEIIIHEGEIGGELFVLLAGDIEITKRLTLYSTGATDQKDKSLIRLKAASKVFFGEMSMFGSEERSATVRALTDVTLGVLTQEQVKILCKEDPHLGCAIFFNIGQKLATDLRRANRDILKLTTAFCLALEGK